MTEPYTPSTDEVFVAEFKRRWNEADAAGLEGHRVESALLPILAKVRAGSGDWSSGMRTEAEIRIDRRAVDVILDNLDPPSVRLGRTDWCMNVEKIVRALMERGLLSAAHDIEAERDALAAFIAELRRWSATAEDSTGLPSPEALGEIFGESAMGNRAHDILAERDAQKWDEGADAVRNYDWHEPPLVNPYRARAEQGEQGHDSEAER